MDLKNKLVEYMKYIISTYPKGCASCNWLNEYDDILEHKRLPEDYEIENIVEDCLNEFHYEDLGFCGCGNPEYTHEVIRQILNIKNSEDNYQDKQNKFSSLCNSDMENENYDGLIQFVLYVLDNKGFLEHGGSIGGAWLTKKGEIYLDLLNMQKEIMNREDNIRCQ